MLHLYNRARERRGSGLMSGLLKNLWVGIEVKFLFIVFMDNLLPLCKVVIVAKTDENSF